MIGQKLLHLRQFYEKNPNAGNSGRITARLFRMFSIFSAGEK